MKVHGYQCDCGCGEKAVAQDHESRPPGWIIVYGPGRSESLHCATWECLARVATSRTSLPVKVAP